MTSPGLERLRALGFSQFADEAEDDDQPEETSDDDDSDEESGTTSRKRMPSRKW